MDTKHHFCSWLLAVGVLTSGSPTKAAGMPSLVKDLTVAPANSKTARLTRIGDTVLFAADDGVHGYELWRTDGTPEGTELVKDIFPGASGALANNAQQLGMVEWNGLLLFWASDGVHGLELWKSNGTEAGTTMVKDITVEGDSKPYAQWDGHSNALSMCAVDGEVFFAVDDGVHGTELWKTDGTEAGTALVKDINLTGDSRPGDMMEYNNELVFSATDGVNGYELWQSDGTAARTVMVADIHPSGNSLPQHLTLFDGKVFFSANDGVNGVELWSTDGTEAGTRMFLDIHSSGSSIPSQLEVIDGLLYFKASDTTTRAEPWVSNGLPNWGSDTRRFAKTAIGNSDPEQYTGFNGSVYFIARDKAGEWAVWKTNGQRPDGSPVNVLLIATLTSKGKILVADDRLYFLDDELWVSDGTEAGSAPLSSQYPNASVGVTGEAVELHGNLITIGTDMNHGLEPWLYAASGSEPSLLRDIHQGTTRSQFSPNSGNGSFAEVNGVGFFVAATDLDGGLMQLGAELWKSDGTEAGTVMVKDIVPGASSSDPKDFIVVNRWLFFTADDGTHGRELWKSDGTESGTTLVRDITTIADNQRDTTFVSFAVVDETLFFAADNYAIHNMLWKSDGSEEGTVMVRHIDPQLKSSHLGEMVAFKGLLYFAAMENNDQELWTSDGTEAGTQLFKNLNESYSSSPLRFQVVGEDLYFTAETLAGRELWKSDGTVDGTVQVADIHPTGSGLDSFPMFTPLNGKTCFLADDGVHGNELWITDGTADVTRMVKDIYPGAEDSRINFMTVVGDVLYFQAEDGPVSPEGAPGVTGRELWMSDGTEAATLLVKDIIPNTGQLAFNSVGPITAAHGVVYFVVNDGIHGPELWTSDGTAAGTHLLEDLYPGWVGSEPRLLGVIGERGTGAEILLFSADDPFHGRELWKITNTPGLRLGGLVRAVDGQFSFTFVAVSGRTYTIDRSEDLLDWTTLESFNNREGPVTFTDTEAAADYFYYRVLESE